MSLNSIMKSALAIILLSGTLSATAYADRDGRHDHDRRDKSGYDHRRHDGRDIKQHKPSRNYRLDDRYRHDHYYPRRGHVVKKLPERRHHFHHHDRDYYFFSGIWYRPLGRRYVVTSPPIGIVVPILPAFYTTLWISGIPYYYANDVYYVWRPDRDGYEVTEPPGELDELESSILADELFIYPKEGQSEQKQADDRYACHRWSVDQTDYDPTLPPEDISLSEARDLRDAYQRAMRACLDGRGYSVR